jgi:excisionase family DNA binding protein
VKRPADGLERFRLGGGAAPPALDPDPQPLTDPFYTPKEVAAMFKVTLRSVYNWLDAGKLQGYRVGDLWRITPEQIESFLAGPPQPDPGAAQQGAAGRPGPKSKSKRRR